MKKIILLVFIAIANLAHAQNKNVDSLKAVLSKTINPKEKFAIINEILITTDGYQGEELDTTACLTLLKIARQQKDDAMLATSYNWIGYYFLQNKGDNTAALDYYFKGLPLAEKVGDKRRISSLCFDISNVYGNLMNQEEAHKFVLRGGKNLPEKTAPMYHYMLVQYQRGKALYFRYKKQLDSASYYAQAMLQTSNRLKSNLYRSQANSLNGAIYGEMGEKEMAEIYFRKSKLFFNESIKISTKNNYYVRHLRFLIDNNKVDDAKTELDEFWKLTNKSHNGVTMLLAAGFKREVFEKLHQTDSAYFYSRLEAEYSAKIFDQNNLNQIQAMAFKEQLRLLEEQNKKAELEQQKKLNLQYNFIAIGILTLVILYLLLSRSFITNTKMIEFFGVIALLIVFEFLNLLLHPFLERITHHSPILMLLALVCIAALLVPLHHKVEHWATKKLVEKNKAIRLANAKKTIEQLTEKS